VPALLLGVAFANLFAGIPIDREGIFQGNLFTLLNPYGLLGGVLFVLAFAVHGALWLCLKSEGELGARAARMAKALWLVLAPVAVVFLGASWFATRLWQNLLGRPVLLVLPLVAVAGLLLTRLFAAKAAWWKAWFASSAFLVGAALFGVAGMFPVLLGSSLDPAASLTAFNAASSPLTLEIMLGVVLCFLPLVIGYQIWVYVRFRGPVTAESLDQGPAY